MTLQDISMLISSLALAGTAVLSLLSWLQGRHNQKKIEANTVITSQTAAAVDGQATKLEAVARSAGYREGVIDQAGGVAPGPYPPEKPSP